MEYRAHPSSYLRIATSFASAKEFFKRDVVSLIDEDHLEDFKEWRFREHKIREVTLRHDLHALSKFFQFAIKRKWTRENPVKGVAIPSDKDAVRIQVVTAEEEKQYFRRARKNLALYDLGRLMLNQGVRPDEALSLGKADVDLENGRIFIRDGKSSAARRTLDLTSESKLILAKRMKVTPGGYSLQNGSRVCTLAGSTVRTTVC